MADGGVYEGVAIERPVVIFGQNGVFVQLPEKSSVNWFAPVACVKSHVVLPVHGVALFAMAAWL